LAALIEHEGDTAAQDRGEIRAYLAEHADNPAGHLFAAMRGSAFDNRDIARIAHGETLAGDAAEITLAGNRAVKNGVADNDRLVALELALLRRINDQPSVRQALA